MHRIALAGRKSVAILPKTVAACLADDVLDLQYNWSKKVRGFVLGICLTRSTVLQDIARMMGQDSVKKSERALSEFLRCKKLDLRDSSWKHAVKTPRRMGKKRFYRYRGKVVLVVDSTTYAKIRSRRKKRRMPLIGKVVLHNVPAKETVLVPGCTELWTGLLLKDETCLGITRRLFTEQTLPAMGFSQNALEEVEIRSAVDLVKEAFGVGVILIADRGFRRKDLLNWLKGELRVDFVIRIEGELNVKARGWKGLLADLAPGWPERLQRFWRDDSKDPILSAVRGQAVGIPLDKKGKKRVGVNVVHLTPINRERMDPMFLATTLPIGLREELSKIVSLYSKRWTIETFFANWKEALGAGAFRVFSCWEAIDRLLAMAHMALLVLYLLYVLGQEATRGELAALWRRLGDLLRRWVAPRTDPRAVLRYAGAGYLASTLGEDRSMIPQRSPAALFKTGGTGRGASLDFQGLSCYRIGKMTRIITAVYSKGVFKPLAHVKLNENQKVRISVTDENPDRSDKKWSALLKTVHRRNRKFSSKEIEADITAAIREVRAKK